MSRLFYISTFTTIVIFLMSPPGQAQNITGCINAINGALYNVQVGDNPSGPCGPNDEILQWNQVGPAGADGADGEDGAAGGEPNYEFVGCTDDPGYLEGDSGMLTFTRACIEEFGPGARFSTSVEVLRTTSPPSSNYGLCWVHPVFQPHQQTYHPNELNPGHPVLVDASGVSNVFSTVLAPGKLSCEGWTGGGGGGLVVDSEKGGFTAVTCGNGLQAACSMPVSE